MSYAIYLACLLSLPTVTRIVDGDTVVLSTGERVRLLGVDCPESVHPQKPVQHFGKEASTFTKKHLLGKRVKLTYDQANAARGHKDRYGRLLAYIHTEDGWDHCAELIKQGYGFAYVKFPIERLEEFRRYEKEAREEERGLWGEARHQNEQPAPMPSPRLVPMPQT